MAPTSFLFVVAFSATILILEGANAASSPHNGLAGLFGTSSSTAAETTSSAADSPGSNSSTEVMICTDDQIDSAIYCAGFNEKSSCIERGCGWCGFDAIFACEAVMSCGIPDMPAAGLALVFTKDKCADVHVIAKDRSTKTLAKPLPRGEVRDNVIAALVAGR